MKTTSSEWYLDDNLTTLLNHYIGADHVYIADTAAANLDKALAHRLIESLKSHKAPIIIPLHVNALTGDLGECTNHWVGLYIVPNYNTNKISVQYVNTMGFHISPNVKNLIQNTLSNQFNTVSITEPFLNQTLQYARKVSDIEIDGNMNDCGPMLVYALTCIARGVNCIQINNRVESDSLGSYLRDSFNKREGFEDIYDTFQKNSYYSESDHSKTSKVKISTDLVDDMKEQDGLNMESKSTSNEEIKQQNRLPLKDNKNDIHTVNKEEYNKKKFYEDIDKLIEIHSKLNIVLNKIENSNKNITINKSPDIFDNLAKIGELLHNISWKEDNSDCIRNKHGYRNRHKDEGNKKNSKGAKLDFESLCHLKDIVKDEDYKLLLVSNINCTKSSVDILRQKVQFILSKDFEHLNNNQNEKIIELGIINPQNFQDVQSDDQDVGILKNLLACYHDFVCINKLKNLIELTNQDLYKNLDLNNKIDRYYLGYFFVQLGEAAKEVSEFIKGEGDTPLGCLFTKLGKYRQVIKNKPYIVYEDNCSKIQQMKNAVDKAKTDISRLFDKLLNVISSYKNIEKIKDYNIDFQKKSLDDNDAQLIKTCTESINSGTTDWKKKICNIKKEVARYKELITQYKAKIESIRISKENHNPNNQNINQIFSTKKAKQVPSLLKTYIKNFKKGDLKLSNLLDDIDDIDENLKNKKLCQTKTLKKNFSIIKNNLDQNILEYTLTDFLDFLDKNLDQNHSNPQLIIESHQTKIQKTQELLKISEKKLNVIYKSNNIGQTNNNTAPNNATETDKPHTNSSKCVSEIKKINHEVSNLSLIENYQKDENAKEKKDFARKMSIGFIGQYFKNIKEDLEQYISADSLFLKDFASVMTIRHKKIMHGILNTDQESVIGASREMLLPWQDTVNTLIALHKIKNPILAKIILPEKLLNYLRYAMFCSNQLGNWDDTIKFFGDQKLQDLMSEKIFTESSFVIKFLILRYVGDSYYAKHDFKNLLPIKNQQLQLVETSKDILGEKYSKVKIQVLLDKLVCQKYRENNDIQNLKELIKEEFKKIDDPYSIIRINLQLAENNIEQAENNPQYAQKFYLEAVDYLTKISKLLFESEVSKNDCEFLFEIYYLGHIAYAGIEEYSKAEENLNNLEKVVNDLKLEFKSLSGEFSVNYEAKFYTLKAGDLRNKAFCFLKSENFLQAKEFLNKSMQLYQSALLLHNTHYINLDKANLHLQIGNCYRDLGACSNKEEDRLLH